MHRLKIGNGITILARNLLFYILIIGSLIVRIMILLVFTEAILTNPNPNSTRTKVSVVYNPNDSLLDSNAGKPVLPSKVLTNLEDQLSVDYLFFNARKLDSTPPITGLNVIFES